MIKLLINIKEKVGKIEPRSNQILKGNYKQRSRNSDPILRVVSLEIVNLILIMFKEKINRN